MDPNLPHIGDVIRIGGDDWPVDIVAFVEGIKVKTSTVTSWTYVEGEEPVQTTEMNDSKTFLTLIIQQGHSGGREFHPGTRHQTDGRWFFEKINWPKPLVFPPDQFNPSHEGLSPECT